MSSEYWKEIQNNLTNFNLHKKGHSKKLDELNYFLEKIQENVEELKDDISLILPRCKSVLMFIHCCNLLNYDIKTINENPAYDNLAFRSINEAVDFSSWGILGIQKDPTVRERWEYLWTLLWVITSKSKISSDTIKQAIEEYYKSSALGYSRVILEELNIKYEDTEPFSEDKKEQKPANNEYSDDELDIKFKIENGYSFNEISQEKGIPIEAIMGQYIVYLRKVINNYEQTVNNVINDLNNCKE